MKLMKTIQKFGWVCAVWMLMVGVSWAGGSREKLPKISFHMQTDGMDNPKMIFSFPIGGRAVFFRRVAEISNRDIDTYRPFLASDRASYGLVCVLKHTAGVRWAALTNANLGRYVLASVNGRPVDAVVIDRTVTDNVLVIWRGLNQTEVQQYDELNRKIAEKAAKKR